MGQKELLHELGHLLGRLPIDLLGQWRACREVVSGIDCAMLYAVPYETQSREQPVVLADVALVLGNWSMFSPGSVLSLVIRPEMQDASPVATVLKTIRRAERSRSNRHLPRLP